MRETTGRRLMKIMSERNLKQVDILRLCQPYCEKYGVKLARNDLSQYVSDKVKPKQDKLSILGMALGVSEVWLMGYDVPMDSSEPVDAVQADEYTVTHEAMKLYAQIQKLSPEKQAALQNYLRFLESDS